MPPVATRFFLESFGVACSTNVDKLLVLVQGYIHLKVLRCRGVAKQIRSCMACTSVHVSQDLPLSLRWKGGTSEVGLGQSKAAPQLQEWGAGSQGLAWLFQYH